MSKWYIVVTVICCVWVGYGIGWWWRGRSYKKEWADILWFKRRSDEAPVFVPCMREKDHTWSEWRQHTEMSKNSRETGKPVRFGVQQQRHCTHCKAMERRIRWDMEVQA